MSSPLALFRRLTLVPQGIIVVVSAFLPIFAIVSMFPALPSIMAHFEGHPNARELVPLMVTAPGLAIALFAPFAGWVVDRFGRLKLLIWATFLYGVFGTLPFFLDDLALIFATRLALGVCEGAILTTINTLIADYWEEEGRRDWLFLQGIAGPFLGAAVIRVAGPVTEIAWNGVFLIYLVAFVIFALMTWLLFEPERPHKSAPADQGPKQSVAFDGFPVRTAVLVALVTLFTSTIYYVYMVKGALVFHAVGVTSPSRISELAALPALMVMVGAVIFRLLGNRANGIQIGTYFLFLGTGLLLMGLARDVPQVVTGIVVQQVGIGMSIPALIAWAQLKFPLSHRGVGMGIWTSSFFLGQFTSPWIVARAEDLAGSVQGAFAVAGGAALAGMLVAFAWALTHRRRPALD